MRCVHERQTMRSLERPHLVGIEEDEALLATCDNALRRRARRRRRGPSLGDAPEALLDALLAEWLEQVVEHAELERLERMLARRRREHDERRRSLRAGG